MKRFLRRAAGVTAVALSLVLLTGTALAGNGNGNSANAPGQEKKADATQQSQPAAPADQSAQAQPQQQQSTPPGQAKKQSAGQSTSQGSSPGQAKQQQKAATSTPGVKPSSTTAHGAHNTTCSTGGSVGSVTCSGNGPKADGSKQYGNGKTAAQIAVSRGAPAGTSIYGPGNSQPHKVVACGHKHAVDVHAIKSYSQTDCSAAVPVAPVKVEQTPVVPACGQSVVTVTGGVMHHTGSKSHPYVMIHPSGHSAHVTGKHEDDSVSQSHQVLVANGESCGTPQSPQTPAPQAPAAQVVTPAPAAPATPAAPAAQVQGQSAAAAPAAAAQPQAQGGVLGATATLKPAAKPHRGGVLGTVTNVAGSTLPFTGFPLWIAVLIAVVLIAGGLMLRGRSSATRI